MTVIRTRKPIAKPLREFKGRKKVKEEQFNVSMDQPGAGKTQLVTKQVDAASPEQAISNAKQGDPRAMQATNLTTQKIGGTLPMGTPGAPQPIGAPPQPANGAAPPAPSPLGPQSPQTGLNPQSPRSAMGPQSPQSAFADTEQLKNEARNERREKRKFNKLTEAYDGRKFSYPYSLMLPKSFSGFIRRVGKFVITERYGNLYLVMRGPAEMDAMMNGLRKHAANPLAGLIAQGIVGSIR